jgi:hypothetical protein
MPEKSVIKHKYGVISLQIMGRYLWDTMNPSIHQLKIRFRLLDLPQ